MLKNYLKIALRNLVRHKAYSAINIFGLAIGIACCLFIALYVQDELSYDRFHENVDRIYRLVPDLNTPEGPRELAQSSPPLASALRNTFPEVFEAVRFVRTRGLFAVGEKRFYENEVFYADASVFDIFTYPLRQGDPATALQAPNSIVITQEFSQKYFGDDDPLNQTLTVNNERTYKVTGVLEKIPHNSHLPFDALVSHATLEAINPSWVHEWGAFFYQTYILVPEHFDPVVFETKLPDFVTSTVGEAGFMILHLQRLTEIYLHSHRRGEVGVRANAPLVYIFSGVAVFILLIACVNFMNLATAKSSERAKEVGMRKVVGARRRQVAKQFLSETMLLSFIASAFALAICYQLLPYFNQLAGKEIAFSVFANSALLVPLSILTLLVGVIAGSYPAFVLSGFRPNIVLKGAFKATSSGRRLRMGLVVFQFTLSVLLIIGTAVILRQVDFLRNQYLGFDDEHILVIDFRGDDTVREKADVMKNELLGYPDIQAVSLSSSVPGRGPVYEHTIVIDNADSLDIFFGSYAVDYDFIENYGIEMAGGRQFSPEFRQGSTQATIINEAALSKLGWSSPEQAIGKKMDQGGLQSRIIGVAKDFNFNSLHELVEPLCLMVAPENFRYFSLRIQAANPQRLIAELETKWRAFAPHLPFDYFFLDDQLDAQYRAEMRFGQVFGVAAGLAIFIACLGLFGLAAFATQQRTKEIGIRKILGAGVAGIILLLSKDFVKLILISLIIAIPVATFVAKQWLENFAYRTELTIDLYVMTGLVTLLIAIFTISFQAIKAALANPVEALRYE